MPIQIEWVSHLERILLEIFIIKSVIQFWIQIHISTGNIYHNNMDYIKAD